MLLGSIVFDGDTFDIRVHVLPRGHRAFGGHYARDIAFRNALHADPELVAGYTAAKRSMVEDGARRASVLAGEDPVDQGRSSGSGRSPPIAAGDDILGGGQPSRMLAPSPARSIGYRIAVLDPDPTARQPRSLIE